MLYEINHDPFIDNNCKSLPECVRTYMHKPYLNITDLCGHPGSLEAENEDRTDKPPNPE